MLDGATETERNILACMQPRAVYIFLVFLFLFYFASAGYLCVFVNFG